MSFFGKWNHRTSVVAGWLVAAALCFMLVDCGVGKSGVQKLQTANENVQKTFKTENIADSIDYNTKLRLRYFYDEAVKQQSLGNYDAAYELLVHCRSIAPNAAAVHFSLSTFDDGLNSKQMAIADIRRAAELDPQNPTYQERLAMTYVATKDYTNAIKSYEKLYSANPERTDVLEILLKLYAEVKNAEKMISTVERMEIAEGVSERTVLTKMHIYSLQGKKKEEYNTLKNFVDRYPNDLSYQVMMGNWLLSNGKKKEAMDLFQKVQKVDPENGLVKLSMIDYYRAEKCDSIANRMEENLLLAQNTSTETKISLLRNVISYSENHGGDSTRVISLFGKILAQKQKTADVAEMYVAYLSLKKMPQDSIVAGLKRVLDIAPDNKGARLQLVQTLWDKVDMDEIISICKPAIEYNPDEMAFYYFLGFAYVQKGEDDKALDVLRKGVAQAKDTSEPSLVSDMYSYIGDILHERGAVDECYAAYDSCLQWKEDNVGCLNNYAYWLGESGGDLAKAEEMSYKTVKAEPNNSIFLDTYAWILFHEKRYSEAQIYIEQALANDSTKSAVYFEHAGDIYIMLGMGDKALDMWKKAIDNGAENKALVERKIKLKKYIPADIK